MPKTHRKRTNSTKTSQTKSTHERRSNRYAKRAALSESFDRRYEKRRRTLQTLGGAQALDNTRRPRKVSTIVAGLIANIDRRRKQRENKHMHRNLGIVTTAGVVSDRNRSIRDHHKSVKKRIKNCEEKRKQRRAVLLSIGKVNKSGGAPGKRGRYRRTPPGECT
jgi:chromatin segregation and condensation protein Rec8/ScpA/Scc1 (kleisin family)